jgi:hypothetical protein
VLEGFLEPHNDLWLISALRTKELVAMWQRWRIFGLGRNAIHWGERDPFSKLEFLHEHALYEDIKGAIEFELARIQRFYAKPTTRSADFELKVASPDGSEQINEQIATSVLIQELGRGSRLASAKAALLLGDRNESEVPPALLNAARRSRHLDVIRNSIIAFERLIGFHSENPFDPSSAESWWAEYQHESGLP